MDDFFRIQKKSQCVLVWLMPSCVLCLSMGRQHWKRMKIFCFSLLSEERANELKWNEKKHTYTINIFCENNTHIQRERERVRKKNNNTRRANCLQAKKQMTISNVCCALFPIPFHSRVSSKKKARDTHTTHTHCVYSG